LFRCTLNLNDSADHVPILWVHGLYALPCVCDHSAILQHHKGLVIWNWDPPWS
jgi:hypothetical protein